MSTFNLPSLEARVQARWTSENTFTKSLRPHLPRKTLLEGPPTMNGSPGVHHALARVHKDLYGRLWTMQGFYVPRRAGWDCHGLPVELSVSSALGLTGPNAVEEYGVSAFTEMCRESVLTHQTLFTNFTKRLGYWVDTDNPWSTMDPAWVEKSWSVLKELHAKDLLTKQFRVSPWCTSCQTSLSSHEESQGARLHTDETVTVGLTIPELDAELLVWTTTPWTLAENVLVGLNPTATYVLANTPQGRVLVGEKYVPRVKDAVVERVYVGAELVGVQYLPPVPGADSTYSYLVALPWVSPEAGTGFVHLAPMYGKDDLAAAQEVGVSVLPLMQEDGVFTSGPFQGMRVWEVSVDDLARLGVSVWATENVERDTSWCWRCGTRLVQFARTNWFLRTTLVKDKLLAFEDQTVWHPENLKYRRWVEGVVDWAVSRERYWGVPLPVWTCAKEHVQVVGSVEELSGLVGKDLQGFDMHRPFVDTLTFPCHCGLLMRREEAVLDTWFDSGLVPVVLGAPTADLVAEGSDQVRGWFYTMSALAAMLDRPQPFAEAVSLGMVLDKDGKKMSKSRGNGVDPFAVFDVYGADALRWMLLSNGSSGTSQKFTEEKLSQAGALFAQVWACAAMLDGTAHYVDLPEHALEKWMRARTDETVQTVSKALANKDPHTALLTIENLVVDLSTKFLRARRNSFTEEAESTAFYTLRTLSLLMAPVAPHFAEGLWEELRLTGSVHLQSWPEREPVDTAALEQGTLLFSLVDTARTLRARASMRLRQPLATLTLHNQDLEGSLQPVLATLLNVDVVQSVETSPHYKPNWRALGKRFGKNAKAAVEAVSQATGSSTLFTLNGEVHTLKEGEDYTATFPDPVELDLTLTPELVRRGSKADLLRALVDARKAAGCGLTEEKEVYLSLEQSALLMEEDLRARYLVSVSTPSKQTLVLS